MSNEKITIKQSVKVDRVKVIIETNAGFSLEANLEDLPEDLLDQVGAIVNVLILERDKNYYDTMNQPLEHGGL